jgi:hypothetical protein
MTTRWIFVALAAVLAVGAFVDVHANDEGKALYVGGSSKEFPAGGLASRGRERPEKPTPVAHAPGWPKQQSSGHSRSRLVKTPLPLSLAAV